MYVVSCSGAEERFCRAPEFKLIINQSININQSRDPQLELTKSGLVVMALISGFSPAM